MPCSTQRTSWKQQEQHSSDDEHDGGCGHKGPSPAQQKEGGNKLMFSSITFTILTFSSFPPPPPHPSVTHTLTYIRTYVIYTYICTVHMYVHIYTCTHIILPRHFEQCSIPNIAHRAIWITIGLHTLVCTCTPVLCAVIGPCACWVEVELALLPTNTYIVSWHYVHIPFSCEISSEDRESPLCTNRSKHYK